MRRNFKKLNKKDTQKVIFMGLLLMLTLGYALISTNLNITGTSNFARTTWNIHFENLVPSTNMTLGSGDSAAAITPNKTTEVTYSLTFSEPGEYYEFLVDAKNDGTLNAMVNTVTSTIKIGNGNATPITTSPSNLPAYLEYSATYADGDSIEQYHLLKSGAKETYKVRIVFRTDIENTDLPGSDQTLELKFGVEYVQADSHAIRRGPAGATLDAGRIVNAKLKELYWGQDNFEYLESQYDEALRTYSSSEFFDDTSYPYDTCGDLTCNRVISLIAVSEYNITNIEIADSLPNNFTPTPDNTLSSSASEYPIYAWFSDDSVYIYSEADTIYLNSDSSYLLSGLVELTNVDFMALVDTSRVTDLSFAFARCEKLTDITGLSGIDVSHVTNMYNVFDMSEFEAGSHYKNLNVSALSNWNVSNVQYMGGLFKHCTLSNLNSISGWNTSSVTDMKYMFDGGDMTSITSLTPISGWNTGSVTNMEGMFYLNEASTFDISGFASWNTSNVTNISGLFYGAIGAQGTIAIKGNPTSYTDAFLYAGDSGSGIVVNYGSGTTNIDAIIATGDSNIITKGSQI